MKKPIFLEPEDEPVEIGRVFGTPLVVTADFSRYPLAEVFVTAMFFYFYQHRFPTLGRTEKLKWGLASMMATLGSEWGHNLAHAFAAARIGKPVDAIRINLGMPLLIYFDPDDLDVSPREHMLRAIGGPAFNMMTLLPLRFLLGRSVPDTPQHMLTTIAYETNLFLSSASFSPLPFLDGGPLLKWSLVQQGRSRQAAEAVVKRANWLGAAVFSIAGTISYLSGKRLIGAMLALIGLSSIAIALGWMEDAY